MLRRLLLTLALLLAFVLAWRVLDRIPVAVVGQSNSMGPLQEALEKPFFEHLALRTGLPLDVQYQPFDTLGFKDTHQLLFLKKGMLDLVSLRFLQNASTEPGLLGLDLPGMNADLATARAVADAYAPRLDRRLQEHFNAKLLGLWPFGPQVFFCRHAVRHVSDLLGRKVRTGSVDFEYLVTALGATPIVMPYGDVKDALKNGLIDCALSSAASADDAGWPWLAPHVFLLQVSQGINGYVINLNLWNRLSHEQQQTLQHAFGQLTSAMWDKAQWLHAQALSCNTGGACAAGAAYRLTVVMPSAADRALMQDAFERQVLADWIGRCEALDPGCTRDWQQSVGLVLGQRMQLRGQGEASR